MTLNEKFGEDVGPIDERMVQEAIQVCNKAERYGDYAVLTMRQAEAIVEFFRWIGWEALGVSVTQESRSLWVKDDEYDITEGEDDA